jgi:hypothetical protein
MKLDDYEDRMGRLTAAVASVETKAAKPVGGIKFLGSLRQNPVVSNCPLHCLSQ